MKRMITGFEVDWASERVFAEQQTAPNYGYLFEVSADRKRIVRCVHISAIGGDSDNPDGDAERLEKNARQAVEEFLGCERESGGLLGLVATAAEDVGGRSNCSKVSAARKLAAKLRGEPIAWRCASARGSARRQLLAHSSRTRKAIVS
jgi:hypothetical protein